MAEDHAELAETVAAGLRREGMAVDLALDGQQALDRVRVTGYDVIVLDRDLPEVHGDEVCRQLVGGGCESRILMLTAAATIEDRVDGLGLGADDYLPKPFAFAELVARIRALARRSRHPLPPLLARGDLRLDPAHRVATRAGRRLTLTPKEFSAAGSDGLGLGLSIVAAITKAHHGNLTINPGPHGGLDIDISFPVTVAITPATHSALATT